MCTSKKRFSSEERQAKKNQKNLRQRAVREAWLLEKQRVLEGKGTRDWTLEEQKELIETDSISGYQGHHMKNVATYPEFAGDPHDIQFLTFDEHLHGAHQSSFKNSTNGYYDPNTGIMHEFTGDGVEPLKEIDLSVKYIDKMKGGAASAGIPTGQSSSNSSGGGSASTQLTVSDLTNNLLQISKSSQSLATKINASASKMNQKSSRLICVIEGSAACGEVKSILDSINKSLLNSNLSLKQLNSTINLFINNLKE